MTSVEYGVDETARLAVQAQVLAERREVARQDREVGACASGAHPSTADALDPYPIFRMLLLPLENVKQSPRYHPEGDVLYHSLQVFELATAATDRVV